VENRRELLRSIPSVDRVLEHPGIVDLGRRLPRWTIIESAREVLAEIRKAITDGQRREEPLMAQLVEQIGARAQARSRRGIRKVVNATGVVIHTNLGRAILSDAARRAVDEVAGSYSSLEIDFTTGKRTSRTMHIESLLKVIIGCESGFAVNNNAGAVLLALNTLADGRETIVSRGELVEIGGSFRLPEVMDKSGARMVEVGTTNRTRLEDYEQAITDRTAVILKVHQSNFWMDGFVESVPAKELAGLAHRRGLTVIEDLGSGALMDFSQFGIEKEPLPQDSLRDGVDVVTFSGDKLLCGPQAGIVIGKRDPVNRMKQNPLTRALRIDKMTLAALEETLRSYLQPETVVENIPTLRMISCSADDLKRRATSTAKKLTEGLGDAVKVSVREGRSQIGGGSLPAAGLPTHAIALTSESYSADEIVSVLRSGEIAIFARISEANVILDFRTVQPSEDEMLVERIIAAFAGGGTK
jgi:L-seryl-tRNA(Ser) seleniumtransferase